ncbi:MAG: alpha/beta hydrolase [Acidimicrobiia bacterium]|nr:alpha/beta hydrolase [Acidimicrobiia bacterium]MDH5237182.1 alpha/beta hydrolase [Acidimicrobiia bacterium]
MAYAHAADGARIFYRVTGPDDGPPLLMLHGLGTDQLGWMLQRRPFNARYRTIMVDNRGSGRSDKPPGPYRLEDLAADAVAVLDDLAIESAHIMGASMGGALSQIIAVMYPERVRSLVLACTACQLQPWRQELFEDWVEQARTQGMHRWMTANLQWLIGPRSMRRLWPVANVIGLLAQRAPVHGLIGQLQALLAADDDLMVELANVSVPTLMVVGSQDILTPVADSELLAATIPGSRMAVIRGAAHGLMIEHARIFNDTVLEFLDEVSDADAVNAAA